MQDNRWVLDGLCREIVVPTIIRRVRSKCRGLSREHQDDIIGDGQEKVLRDPRARLLMEAIVHGDASLTDELAKRVWWLTGRVIAEYFRQTGQLIKAQSLEAELAGEDGESFALIDTVADEEPDPLQQWVDRIDAEERQERARRLWELIPELVESQRVVVVMRLQGFTFEEIAEILSNWEGREVRAGALRVRQNAAINRLRQLYRERFPDDPRLE